MPTQVEKLEQAGILNPTPTPQDYLDAINDHLTDDEVQQLIDIKNKLAVKSGGVKVPIASFE